MPHWYREELNRLPQTSEKKGKPCTARPSYSRHTVAITYQLSLKFCHYGYDSHTYYGVKLSNKIFIYLHL